jgi:hypothetical protein
MSEKLTDLLTGALAPGIYRLASRANVAIIAARAEKRGWRFFHLDGQQIATKDHFLRACATAMRFPSYFGNNWDALEDSLRDLAWIPAQSGYLLLYDAAGRFATAHPEDFAVALDILHQAIASWQATSTPMAVLLRGVARGTPAFSVLTLGERLKAKRAGGHNGRE